MKKYAVAILEGVAILVGLVVYSIVVVVPEYKEKFGSSDSFIRSQSYQNMIEMRIDGKTDFGMVMNSKGEIYHLFFFDNSSVFLYNKNIENHTLKDSVATIMVVLLENKLLTKNSKVEILSNNESYTKEFMEEVQKSFEKYNLLIPVEEKEISLEERAKDFGILASKEDVLLELDFYSKEIIKNQS